jgi:hypothetical protein
LAVVLLHGVLILLIARSDQRPPQDSLVTSIWLDVQSVEPRVETPPPPEEEQNRAREPASSSRAPPIQESPPSTAISIEVPRTPDWHASATLAASAAVGREVEKQGRRQFGPREEPAKAAAAPSIFDQPRHKLGDLGEDALGYKVVWLGDNCYTALEAPMSQLGRVAMILNATMCAYPVGKKPARGDLFDGMDTNEETER